MREASAHEVLMHRFRLLILAATLLFTHAAGRAAPQTAGVVPSPVVLSCGSGASAAGLARPRRQSHSDDAERAAAVSHGIRGGAASDARSIAGSDRRPRLREGATGEGPVASGANDDRPEAIVADTRWMALPENAALVETVVASDPDPTVSLAALEALRRWRMRHLNTLLNERVATETKSSGSGPVDALLDAQERWVSLERGTMLPAFVRSPAAPFTAAPVDQPVRVVAFGDFGRVPTRAEGAWSHARRLPRRAALRLGDHPGRQLLQRGHRESGRPTVADPVEQVDQPLGITFYAALGNHDWGHPDSPAAEILDRQDDDLANAKFVLHILSRPGAVFRAGYAEHRGLREAVAMAGWRARTQRGAVEGRLRSSPHLLLVEPTRIGPTSSPSCCRFFGIAPTCTSAVMTTTFRPSDQRATCTSTSREAVERASTSCGHTNAPSSRAARTALP